LCGFVVKTTIYWTTYSKAMIRRNWEEST
jgi:hypothetical protein